MSQLEIFKGNTCKKIINRIFIDSTSIFNTPVSKHQEEFINAIGTSNIVVGVGDKGLGKTESAVFISLLRYATGLSEKIVLISPEINFPNNYYEISSEYRKIFIKFIGEHKTDELIKHSIIEVLPLIALESNSCESAIILVEDGQLCTPLEIKLLLSSITYNSRLVLMGDLNDTFLKNNGLKNLIYNLYMKDLNISKIDLQLVLFNL